MSMMGELTYFIGLQIKQTKEGIFINQNIFAQKIKLLTFSQNPFNVFAQKIKLLIFSQNPFLKNVLLFEEITTKSDASKKTKRLISFVKEKQDERLTSKMVKVKNANVGRGKNVEEGGSSRGRTGKGKRVASGVRALERFISVKEAANFKEWTRKRTKIAPGHRVDLSDMEGMEIIPDLFNDISWRPLLTVNELERRFEEIFTKGEVLKRHDDINVSKLDAYGRLMHHMISNIIIPNVGHNDLIGAGKIYNKHTFKIMGFEKNEEGMLVRGGQDESDEDDEDNEGNEGQEEKNIDEEESKTEQEEETFRRELRQKRRQERVKKKKTRCTREVSRVIYKEAKYHLRQQEFFIKMK
ncbi:hypothetical protein M9H77_28102 [Catharanthus roseus]|uniref:Uncharacterized protein n=1 Tax=Catharanthus roseus TaxID=4058 RepID=A0ACC0AGJ9_CATRO|nr:hypothetical protein M9H77_28102 [Catharanthus roseus]